MTAWTITRPFPDADMQRKAEWVAMMMSASATTAAQLSVTPEAIVAQAALESGWGSSTVGRFGLFGVKADASWQGARVLCRTREFVNGQYVTIDDWFRDYPSAEACIADHFAFLQQNSRYRDNGVFAGQGDTAYFAALMRAGYATDPNYSRNLVNVENTIRSYFLKHMTSTDDGPTGAAPILAEPVAVPPAAAPRTLLIGCTGADVAALQRRLNLVVDSTFGPTTQAAVQAWQTNHGLVADGIVGPATRVSLGF